MISRSSTSLLYCIPSLLEHRAICAGSLAILLTVVLELTCLSHVRKLLLSGIPGRGLYVSAWRVNLFNQLLLGPLTYYGTVRFLCDQQHSKTLCEQAMAAVGIVIVEAMLYYIVHKSLHEVKGLYWMHSYHHRFNTVVLPSSASAVSVAEYIVAYMFPLVSGVCLTRADEAATFAGAFIVAVAHVLIHTPWLEDYEYPSWIFVSASDHLNHHRKARDNYGAPVFHLDRIVERCFSSFESRYDDDMDTNSTNSY